MAATRVHWPEYLIEGALLGTFMVAAGAFATMLEHPASPVHRALPDPFVRRLLMGLAMGMTAVALIYSRWGKRSGAHFNPAVTLTFLRLGKIAPRDAAGYVAAQFAGGALGLLAVGLLLRAELEEPHVGWVATMPGAAGVGVALAAEAAISFVLMLVVLSVSNAPRIARATGFFAGCLVATWITFEAPLSGMSMNPARSFASALAAGRWSTLWIYFVAPTAGMLLAAEVFVLARSRHAVLCAKLHHDNDERCIFRCNYRTPPAQPSADGPPSLREEGPAPLGRRRYESSGSLLFQQQRRSTEPTRRERQPLNRDPMCTTASQDLPLENPT